MKFDLHLHSCYSDGTLPPAEVVNECHKAGLKIIAITDHDNVSGIPGATEAGADSGIEVIPGIELAVTFMDKERHILGYFIDWQNPDLEGFLKQWEERRVDRAKIIIEKLVRLGFDITLDKTIAQTKGSLDRSHICWAVFDNKKNAEALKRWGITEKDDFFRKFLLDKPWGEGLAYAPLENPPAKLAIELIQDLGGMAFLAHPFWKTSNGLKEVEAIADNLRMLGLDGIESFYFIYNKEQTIALHDLAQRLSLLESGGSDFHGTHTKKSGRIGDFQLFGLEPRLPFKAIWV